MAAPKPSALDFSQCIQGAYDDAAGRLRIEGQATIVNGAIEVAIDASYDNIAIKNPTSNNVLAINADGSINVNTTFSGTIAVGSPDKTAFTYGSSNELSIGGVFQDTAPTLSPGQAGAARLTQYRGFHTNLRNSSGNEITSSSNGAALNQVLHTQTPDTPSATVSLNGLNATVSIPTAGLNSVGFQILAGSLIGTIIPELSIDGGLNYTITSFYNPITGSITPSLVYNSANTTNILSIALIGGTSHVRVRVSVYTSGSANSIIRASTVSGLNATIVTAPFSIATNNYPLLSANTPNLILSSNPNRKFALISNNSGNTVAIQLGTGAGLNSINKGISITTGNYYQFAGNNLYTGDIYAFTTSASVTLSVVEGTP